MLRVLLFFLLALPAWSQPIQDVLQAHAEEVEKPGRRTVGAVLDDLIATGAAGVPGFLEAWRGRQVVRNAADGRFYIAGEETDGAVALTDVDSGERTSVAEELLTESRPNGGVRREIGGALVRFQLSDPDIARRQEAVAAIARSPAADQIEPLGASIEGEPDAALRAEKQRLVQVLLARFGEDSAARVAAIEGMGGTLSLDTRAVLSQILATEAGVAATLPEANIARVLEPGADLPEAEAYGQLVEAGLAPALVSDADIRAALIANISEGIVGGVPVGLLSDPARRLQAYDALEAPARVSEADVRAALRAHVFFEAYEEPDAAVTAAAARVLSGIERQVGFGQALDLGLDALSLASIYFLAAIGLAITFGVMRVINMAHGEFIMMGAYTGYVVQTVVPNYTLSLVIALPLAFLVGAGAGVLLERLVIRHLYHRPLETLLATFGISIALQQLAKNIFGTQARPLTSPSWLDGAWALNDVVQISYIRIAIFVLALIFLVVLVYILRRTRLGLEVRAVTQNPGMAGSMGINPDRINMLTFGLGSGHCGNRGRRNWALCAGHVRDGRQLHRAKLHDRRGRRGRQRLWDAGGGGADRFAAKGDRMAEPVEHPGRTNLHDPVRDPLHSGAAAWVDRAEGPGGGGLMRGYRSSPAPTRGGLRDRSPSRPDAVRPRGIEQGG